MCNRKPIGLFQSVEVPVNAGASTKVMIPDQPQLRIQKGQRIYIQGIEVFSDVVSPTSPNGVANATLAELQKGSLCLYVKGEEKIYRYPLLALVGINDLATPFRFELPEFADLEVDWAKSYIQYSSAPVPAYVVLLGIQYSRVLTNE